jgi:hypothetical protein
LAACSGEPAQQAWAFVGAFDAKGCVVGRVRKRLHVDLAAAFEHVRTRTDERDSLRALELHSTETLNPASGLVVKPKISSKP